MTTNRRILLINGPNMNMLGAREAEHYGQQTLETIVANLTNLAKQLNVQLECVQSNAEHQLIDAVHKAMGNVDFIIINPAALTHSSIALRDAILAVDIPFIEVHLSNVHARETFRHHSYFSDIAQGVITGLGADGYEFALKAAARRLLLKAN